MKSIIEMLKGNKGLQQLKDHEGLALRPYRCTGSKLTIGYGRNLDANGISESEADFLLYNDVEARKKQIKKKYPWFKKLNKARQWVIINMVFNLGINNKKTLKSTTDILKDKFEGRDRTFEDVANIMLAGKWATQVKGRARQLAQQMKTGEFQE